MERNKNIQNIRNLIVHQDGKLLVKDKMETRSKIKSI